MRFLRSGAVGLPSSHQYAPVNSAGPGNGILRALPSLPVHLSTVSPETVDLLRARLTVLCPKPIFSAIARSDRLRAGGTAEVRDKAA